MQELEAIKSVLLLRSTKMLAARDQENLIHGHQQVAASKPLNQSSRGLQPKTPAYTYPKTPLKIPLQDENAEFGGKSVRGKGLEHLATRENGPIFNKDDFVTPLGTTSALRFNSQLTV